MLTLLYFIIIIGIIIFVHELGHFIFAKKFGVYVHEFALGMGPKIYQFRRKNDETVYTIRAIPIGGFVSMAGEEVNTDEKIPKEKRLYSKPIYQRFLIMIAGVALNFVLAWFILFCIALINGATINQPIISSVLPEYDIANTEIASGAVITAINDKKIRSVDRLLLELHVYSGQKIALTYLQDGSENTVNIKPKKEEINDQEVYRYGFVLANEIQTGIGNALKFAFVKSYNLIEQMVLVISYLATGVLSMDSLSGPVGIFSIVGESASAGFLSVLMLVALISINVGFINLLPLPALDGGRILFLLVEKIKGSPIKPEVENVIHAIGFILLIALIIYITFNDIINLV